MERQELRSSAELLPLSAQKQMPWPDGTPRAAGETIALVLPAVLRENQRGALLWVRSVGFAAKTGKERAFFEHSASSYRVRIVVRVVPSRVHRGGRLFPSKTKFHRRLRSRLVGRL